MMYNDNVERLFFAGRHAGFNAVEGVPILHYVPNASALRVSFLLERRDKRWRLRYKVRGNPYIMAACEWICEQAEQQQNQWDVPSLDEVMTFFAIPQLQQVSALQIVEMCRLVREALKKSE